MIWRATADLVMIVHLAFIVFVVAGGYLTWRWRRIAYVHVPVAIYGVTILLAGFTCPLTPLEKALRRRAGSTGYDGGFVEHYVVPVLYPGEFTAATKLVLAGLVLVATVAAYAVPLFRHRPNASRL